MKDINRLVRSGLVLSLLLAGLAGCALEAPLPSTGYLPANAFAGHVIGEDPAMAAMSEATWDFAHPRAMQGRPSEMALAVASLDALAGQFSTGGRWIGMNWLAKQQMLQAREAVRAVLGIKPGTPSQTVIDSMVTISHALQHGDRKAALAAAGAPEFTFSPTRVLDILAHFPPVPIANQATMAANRDFFPGGSGMPPFNR